MKQTTDSSTTLPPALFEMAAIINDGVEYRPNKDDNDDEAWYNCRVDLEDGNQLLRIKFQSFYSLSDEVFTIADFSTHRQIQQFLHKFRPLSEPLDVSECSRLVQGMRVCAVYRGKQKPLRYYDAIVDAVHYKEHTPEMCLCSYSLSWQHGPGKGSVTETTIEDICLITRGEIHPKVAEFTDLVKQKLKEASVESQVFDSSGHGSPVGSCAGREALCPELSDHDKAIGGEKETDCHHYIVLENLDKDLCPLLMMDFIHEHTSITAQTYVFPSLLLETYTKGAILVDNNTKLKTIYEFISNPNHFITSFTGRPWVVGEDNLRSGTFNTNLQSLQPKYGNYSTKHALKVVRLGTEEYMEAKQSRDVYLAYRNYQKGLMQRLAKEENKKRDSSS